MIVNDPATLAELSAAFADYERALGANDTEMLDTLFWNRPETVRYGVGENLYGHAAIADFRRVRPGGSPPRALQNTIITTYGGDFGTANTEFIRAGSTRIGRQSQTWLRAQEGWRIVSAHVSFMDDGH